MKKRKPPFFLAALLVVMLGAVGFMNYSALQANSEGGHGHDHAHDHDHGDQEALDTNRSGAGTDDRQAALASVQKAAEASPKEGSQSPKLPVSNEPLVTNPDAEFSMPKPNDNQTAGQWYADESRKAAKDEKR